jgi:DNA-binding IclR family transcriptional regulator
MKKPPVKSALRVLEILELFSEVREPLNLKQISETLGYPSSSCMMLLKSLVKIGYLNFNLATRTYYPGIRVKTLGSWLNSQQLVSEPLEALVRRLHVATKETVVLAIQNDIYIHFIRVIDSSHDIRFFVPEDGMRTLLQSNLGWLMLAQKPKSKIHRICDRIEQEEPRKFSKLHKVRFLQEQENISKQGFCYVPNIPTDRASSIAMLLPCTYNGQQVAVAVGGLVDRLDAHKKQILSSMRSAIADFERDYQTNAS